MKFKVSKSSSHILLIAVLMMAVVLSGCASAGRYKNPNTSTIMTIKLNDALKNLLKKGTHYFAHEWNIYSNENCSREEGYGKAAYFSDWYTQKIEEKTSLQTGKRIYIEATIVTEPKAEPVRNHCNGVVSFIPEKNTEYIAEQYIFFDQTSSHCKIEIKDAATNVVPASFLMHKDCGDHLFF